MTAALRRAGIIVVEDGAVRAGGLAVGGLGDAFTRHADVPATLRALDEIGGPAIVVSHSPDVFPDMPARFGLVLAGHTHCGQVRLPLIGALSVPSRYGRRFDCGLFRRGSQQLIVSAGLGTSMLPIRLGAPPDIWIIDVNGQAPMRRAQPSSTSAT